MKILQTPDERFSSLPDWPYEPKYTLVDSTTSESIKLRIHHVDTGASTSGETVLCMHGEPSWSFLYRKMIPRFVAAGHRVVAPDLVGFGRSDKPSETSDYTYERHVDWMTQWLVANDLNNLTLVCQDWGGLIGLRLVAAMPERFSRVVAANTFLNIGDRPPSEAFMAWHTTHRFLTKVTRLALERFRHSCRSRLTIRHLKQMLRHGSLCENSTSHF